MASETIETIRARFTPGPWKVGYRALDVLAPLAKGGDTKVCDIRGWGYLTGKGHGALGLSDEEAVAIQTANARLIAAAPAMYDAIACAMSGNLFGEPEEAVAIPRRAFDAMRAAMEAANPPQS